METDYDANLASLESSIVSAYLYSELKNKIETIYMEKIK